MDFCHSREIYPVNMGKKNIEYCYKNRIRCCKTVSKKVGNKFTEKIVKPKPVPGANSINVEEIVIPS